MQICVHAMKAHSYWATNFTYRDVLAFSKNPDLNDHDLKHFPDNANLKTFSYFLFAPTLTYEPSYPRTTRINWVLAAQYLAMFLLACLATYIILINYMMPAWQECKIEHPDGFGQAVRTLVKLSLPTMAMWMLMFFAVFHGFANLSAEVLMFADREFYQDWWNATSFDIWWRKWNRPVHKWMLRHIYHDWMHVVKGTRPMATFITFLISAVLHEFVIAIGLGMFRPILSGMMVLQIGLIWFSKHSIFKGTQVGNVIMWMTVFIGQPLVELAYCYEYNRVNLRPIALVIKI
jgi:diacylglycerol O-acyltransferase-1